MSAPPGYTPPPPRRQRINYAGQHIAAEVLDEQREQERLGALVRATRRISRATAHRAIIEQWSAERLELELARLEELEP